MAAANDNRPILIASLDMAVAGQGLSLRQPHRKFGQAWCEFLGHAGDGKHIIVSKSITSMHRCRWTKPMMVPRSAVIEVSAFMAR